VGIDIEKMQPKIDHIAFKFLQEREMKKLDNLQRIYHLYLHWCAKEALYKICDRPNLSFRENMFIEPFQPKRQGIITGRVETSEIHLRLKLYYFSVENYSIVWCYK
jgi:4'-phosphopantetheinyl transferase EntD